MAGVVAALLLALLCPPISLSAQDDLRFDVTFERSVRHEPFSGRVYLFFARDAQEPRMGPNWFAPEPFVSLDVEDWEPGESLSISLETSGLLKYPKELKADSLIGMRVQAVARFQPWERVVGRGPGNGYSSVVRVGQSGIHELVIDKVVSAKPFPDSIWTKEFRVHSKQLSEFHGRDVEIKAAVTLPASYFQNPERRYPVIFEIPGFGGTHREGIHDQPVRERNSLGVEFIRVMLDPSCPLGHHVFADSANNGPWGTALVTEFLPAFDAQFRTVSAAGARFLTGHSSGGWSSLWIQVRHPDVFGGVWSTAPDPVDFRDFQRIDLYRPQQNMYDDGEQRRPLARMGGRTVLWYDNFDWMEHVLGPGGQLHSFEAVFSPRDEDGQPRRLWNRETGDVDHAVAETWKPYDIRLYLKHNWEQLEPQLRGKIHVYMGTEDTFFLQGATKLLKESLADLGSDATVELVPGRTHFNLLDSQLRQRIEQQMAEKFRQWQAQQLQTPQ